MASNKIAGLLNEPNTWIDQQGLARIAMEHITWVVVLLSDGMDPHAKLLPSSNGISLIHVIDDTLAHPTSVNAMLARKIVQQFEMTIDRTLDVVILYGYSNAQLNLIVPVFGRSTDLYLLTKVGDAYTIERMV